ncbi:hypothetical protein Mycch_1187 [Mycolicibacterium chubuense NBB4]|uniref:Uncharacterized protein n=1 Tax=Mycolicibacterium chubuense (strain NBB4) TaxID=710421 RepID=I4BFD8_MYCCN|nr:hypothetical protein [Mycolicibacterium chubuense]AFM15995.1 hypothetical protein Mycch_1187 [Mycolicibacterium chubuense NBB4]
MAPSHDRRIAVAGIIAAAVLAAALLVPGLRIGTDRPWLGALTILVPTAALLTATGSRHYGPVRAFAVALAVTVAAAAVSWLVALFTLVKALSGSGVEAAWGVLLFVTPVVSVLALGALALRLVPSRWPERSVPHRRSD